MYLSVGYRQNREVILAQLCGFIAQLVSGAMRRHRRGHGFESHWNHLNFSAVYERQLNCQRNSEDRFSITFFNDISFRPCFLHLYIWLSEP